MPASGSISNGNKRIAKNSIYLTIRMIIVLVVSLYTTKVILDALGVEDFGIYNVVAGFVSMFTFLSSAMNNGIQRFYNFELSRRGQFGLKDVYNVSIRIQFILAILLFVTIGIIGLWYIENKMVLPHAKIPDAKWLFISSIISLALIILQVPYSSIVIAKEKMDFYAIISVLNTGLTLLVSFIIKGIESNRLVLYGLCLAFIQLFVFIIYFIYSKKISQEIRFEKRVNLSLLYSILEFSGWNLFGTFGSVMKEQGTNLILNIFCGPIVNAARGIASQVNGGFQSLVSNLHTAVRPQVTQSYANGDIMRTMQLTYSISKLSSIALFMFSYPILLEIDFILTIWLGKNTPDNTGIFIIIVVLASFCSNLNTAISGVVHSSGKMKKYQIIGSVINLLALPVLYFLLAIGISPKIALWSLVLNAILSQVAALYILKSIINFRICDYLSKVIKPICFVVISTMLLPYLLHLYMHQGILRLMVVCVFSVIEIAFIAYTIGLTKSERMLINTMLTDIFAKFK